MKELFLLLVNISSLLVIAMDQPQQLSLLNNSCGQIKDVRHKYFYPILSLQDLGKLVQVNKQCLSEISCVGLYENKLNTEKESCFVRLYKNIKFKNLQESIELALYCYQECGCLPKMIVSSISIPQHENVFSVRQDELIRRWILEFWKVKIWSSLQEQIVDKTKLCYAVNSGGDNYILLKPANGDAKMCCVDAPYMEQKDNPENLNTIMTIYSIGNHVQSLNQDELDAIVNNAIEKPLVIVFQDRLFGNKEIVGMLLNQLRKKAAEHDHKIGNSLQVFGSLSESWQIAKKKLNEEKQSNELDNLIKEDPQLMADQLNMQNDVYLSSQLYQLSQDQDCLIL